MNWDDNLAGATEYGHLDPLVEKVRKKAEDKIKFEFEQTFMFYLPRICEHCLPRLASVHHRLPLQEGVLQPQDG